MKNRAKERAGKNISKEQRAIGKFYGNEALNAAGALTKTLIPPGALGSVDTNVPGAEGMTQRYSDLAAQYAGRSNDQQEVVAGLKRGLEGYTSPEYQAQREQMQRGLNSNLATSLGQLAKSQARGKVYGAAAGAQQQNAIQATQNQKDNLEQDLMVKNIDERQRRLMALGEYTRGLEGEEYGRQSEIEKNRNDTTLKLGDRNLEREKINIGNRESELGSQMNLYLGTLGQGYNKAENRAARKLQREAIRRI